MSFFKKVWLHVFGGYLLASEYANAESL